MGETPILAMDSSKLIISVVSALLVMSAFVVIMHHDDSTSRATIASTPKTNMISDLGSPYVEGYSCHGVTSNPPCNLDGPAGGNGGTCSGWVSESCECKNGYSGAPCDWGPKNTGDDWDYSNNPPQSKEDAVERINMAYGFANAVYKDTDKMNSACPGFSDKTGNALGSSQIHLVSDQASTHAGASFILPGHQSPSGQAEALFGFRGTEFGAAMKEIENGTPPEGVRAILTVLTDLNIARHDVEWDVNGTKHSLGYVHKGFWMAVSPFIRALIGNATDYIVGAHLTSGQQPIINIVGHSLGGALANIFASIVRVVFPDARIYLTTFGSPRVGSDVWVKDLANDPKTHILRVVAGDDVVSLVPTTVGLLDSVMHAGPQLTIGWNGVPDRCHQLVEIKNMWNLLLENNEQNNYISCAIDSVSTYHLNYSYSLSQWMSRQGHNQYNWCNAADLSF